jgi:hypothetical protein
MFGYHELKEQNKPGQNELCCPHKDCSETLPRIRKNEVLTNERFQCPVHKIFISPSTWVYPKEKDNLLWDYPVYESIVNSKGKRNSKVSYDNSEDALTWNVFRFLENENLLPHFISQMIYSTQNRNENTEIYYWSVSLRDLKPWDILLQARVDFGEASGLTEAREKGSEPDLIIVDDENLIFLEAKFTSGNESIQDKDPQKLEEKIIDRCKRYTSAEEGWWNQVFKSDFETVGVDKYQLSRFWLIGTKIAEKLNKKFYLVNLVREEKETDIVEIFKPHIEVNESRCFKRITWEDIGRFIEGKSRSLNGKNVLTYMKNKTTGYASGKLQRAFNL